MANDRVRRAAAILVVVLVAAALLFHSLRPGDAPTAPSPPDRFDTPAAAMGYAPGYNAGDHGATDTLTDLEVTRLTIRGLPTPGCEQRVREREERAAALDIGGAGQAAVAELQHSGDTEHRLAAALMSPDRKQLQQLLDRVLREDPGNRVAHWKNLENCHALGAECDRTAVEAALLAADGANGLAWIDVASARIREERWAEAEAALRRAAVAPRFDSYFMEYALLIERGLAATAEMNYRERMVAGMGYAAATWIPAYGELTRHCSTEAEGYRLPPDLCFEVGEQMAGNSSELLAALIGKSVQQQAAARLGDERLAGQLEREKQGIRDAVLRGGALSGAHVLMQNDTAVMQRYVDTFQAHGEIRAAEVAIAEARRLREDPNYDQCNFVGDPDFELPLRTP